MEWKKLLRAKEWELQLAPFLLEKYKDIISQIKKVSGDKICPNRQDLFNAFNLCDLDQVKIVIIGQDPYHSIRSSGHKVAHGLSFSYLSETPKDKIPPSLDNIFKEIKSSVYNNDDTKIHSDFYNTDLTRWARQGVLLLNTALTSEIGIANKHQVYWSLFTKQVLKILNNRNNPMCVILLGSEAKKCSEYFNREYHLILKAGHPSPLNKNGDFIGSNIFLDAKNWLKNTYNEDILW